MRQAETEPKPVPKKEPSTHTCTPKMTNQVNERQPRGVEDRPKRIMPRTTPRKTSQGRESGPRHTKTINPMEERSQEDRDRSTDTQRQATLRDESMGSGKPAQGIQCRATQQYGSQKGEARQAQGTQRLTPEWQGAS